MEFDVVIVDEAHSLKNSASQAFAKFRALSVRACHRVFLTGTPIQNTAAELYGLLSLLDSRCPEFQSREAFEEAFGDFRGTDQAERLHNCLRPYLLRRRKEDVKELAIPKKEETLIEVELTISQKEYYRALLDRNMAFLKDPKKGSVPKLMNVAMELRKLCEYGTAALQSTALQSHACGA